MTRLRLSVRRGLLPAPRPAPTTEAPPGESWKTRERLEIQALVEEGRTDPVVFIGDMQAGSGSERLTGLQGSGRLTPRTRPGSPAAEILHGTNPGRRLGTPVGEGSPCPQAT
jgi:hypothetical protein